MLIIYLLKKNIYPTLIEYEIYNNINGFEVDIINNKKIDVIKG